MARPKNEARRLALLRAATELLAEQGTGASTLAVARRAGVSEGSLFTYFPDKDALLDAVYRDLRGHLARCVLHDLPHRAGVRERMASCWRGYVAWGVDFPVERRALAHLTLSPAVRAASREAAEAAMGELYRIEVDARAVGILRDVPPGIAPKVMAALGQMTMDLVQAEPARRDELVQVGFDLFWSALSRA